MIPARWDFHMQPGATFVGRIFLCMNRRYEPVNLTACTPIAKVRLDGNSPVILDLAPEVIIPAPLPQVVTVDVGTSVLLSTGHNLGVGTNIVFSTNGILPYPLRSSEHYIVVTENFSPDTFSVISFRSAVAKLYYPVRFQNAGSGTITGTTTHGQVHIPEITDEVTETVDEADAIWDLMIEDPQSRRLAPFVAGDFIIKRGATP